MEAPQQAPADWGRYLVLLLHVRPAQARETPQAAALVLGALDRALQSPASCERLLRRAPGIVPRLLKCLRDEDYSREEVVQLVAQDSLLAAELLRVTRSVLYAHRGQSRASVGHAIDLLGRVGLQQVVARALLRPLLSGEDGGLQLLAAPTIWDDTERCALLCSSVAAGFGLDASDTHYAALLHGMAWSAVLRALELQGAAPALHQQLFDSPEFVAGLRERKARITGLLSASWGVAWAGSGGGAATELEERWRGLAAVVDDMVCVQRLNAAAPAFADAAVA